MESVTHKKRRTSLWCWPQVPTEVFVCARIETRKPIRRASVSLDIPFSQSVLFVFLDEGVGLGVAEVFGFGKILDTFSLVAFEALGIVGCLDGLFIHANSYFKG